MMNREEALYLAPYAFTVLLLVGIFLYTWRHRHIRGAPTYAWMVGGQALTLLGFIFELISPNLETKILWDKFQWLTSSFLVILGFLVFSSEFSGHRFRYPVITWGILLAFLGGFTALLLTDNLHHLFYSNPHLSADRPISELNYDVTLLLYIYTLFYAYGANIYGIGLLINRAFQQNNSYRLQYLIIAAGFLVPLVFSFLALADIDILSQHDATPFAVAISNVIVAWGLFHYGLFDIAPTARQQLVETLSDPVMVLDPMNRIVDINKAALKAIGKSSSEVIGRPFRTTFSEWLAVAELLNDPYEQRRQVSLKRGEDMLVFDVSILPILIDDRRLLGHIIVARDMTRHKTLQASYRKLSEEFDQLVRARTEELHRNAEKYRGVVEHQTEFIVRWKPDGTRTFVNEAYCRYWGITYEQGIARNFLFHIPDEDRPAIEEIISRLDTGEINVETEIYQVIKQDGSTAWQEWTDHAIRDEWGKLIEIQSVGRDITERRRAGQHLTGAGDMALEG